MTVGLWPLWTADNAQYRVALVGIARSAGERGVRSRGICIGAAVTAGVPLVVLLLSRRYFTQSLSSSGVTG